MAAVQGYNVALKLGTKTCIGRTQDDLSVTATVKESITKDDAGVKKFSVTGQEVTFKATGVMEFDGATATKLDSDALLEQALKTGTAAEIQVKYVRGSGDSYSGTAIITSYSESTNSEDEGTYTVDLKVTGSFTKDS